MKKLTVIPFLLVSMPAGTHEPQYLTHAHAHPHGFEVPVVIMVALLFVGLSFWRSKKQQ